MDLDKRQKMYEDIEAQRHLIPLIPIMVRLDGRCFHNWTRGLKRPFDREFHWLMVETTKHLMEESGALLGYTQSDEISMVIYSGDADSQVFFDGRVQKLTSVMASICTGRFNNLVVNYPPTDDVPVGFKRGDLATFDCRVWNVPTKEEAVNAILWREQDASKNSVSMAARELFSHNEIHGKTGAEMQEMMFQKHGVNWNDYPEAFKRGTYIQRKKVVRKFSAEELDKLPPKHQARTNPDLEVARQDLVVRESTPQMSKMVNRIEFVFEGAEPQLAPV
jgi:tRNA(His) 5'-end guanylyltransferase